MAEIKYLLRETLRLSAEDRADVEEALDESLLEAGSDPGADLSSDWKAEITRRIDAVERGASRLIPGEEVEARVRASLSATSAL